VLIYDLNPRLSTSWWRPWLDELWQLR